MASPPFKTVVVGNRVEHVLTRLGHEVEIILCCMYEPPQLRTIRWQNSHLRYLVGGPVELLELDGVMFVMCSEASLLNRVVKLSDGRDAVCHGDFFVTSTSDLKLGAIKDFWMERLTMRYFTGLRPVDELYHVFRGVPSAGVEELVVWLKELREERRADPACLDFIPSYGNEYLVYRDRGAFPAARHPRYFLTQEMLRPIDSRPEFAGMNWLGLCAVAMFSADADIPAQLSLGPLTLRRAY